MGSISLGTNISHIIIIITFRLERIASLRLSHPAGNMILLKEHS